MQAQHLSKVDTGVSASPQFPDISGDGAGGCSQLCGKQPLAQTRDWTVVAGTSLPLGATWIEDEQAWNFALYSKDAEDVTLLFYADADLVSPVFTYRFDYLHNKSGRIWHCRVPQGQLRGARYYAYSVGGPTSQGGFDWRCFDPEKVLLDPYAKSVYFPPAFDRAAASRPGPMPARRRWACWRARLSALTGE